MNASNRFRFFVFFFFLLGEVPLNKPRMTQDLSNLNPVPWPDPQAGSDQILASFRNIVLKDQFSIADLIISLKRNVWISWIGKNPARSGHKSRYIWICIQSSSECLYSVALMCTLQSVMLAGGWVLLFSFPYFGCVLHCLVTVCDSWL